MERTRNSKEVRKNTYFLNDIPPKRLAFPANQFWQLFLDLILPGFRGVLPVEKTLSVHCLKQYARHTFSFDLAQLKLHFARDMGDQLYDLWTVVLTYQKLRPFCLLTLYFSCMESTLQSSDLFHLLPSHPFQCVASAAIRHLAYFFRRHVFVAHTLSSLSLPHKQTFFPGGSSNPFQLFLITYIA